MDWTGLGLMDTDRFMDYRIALQELGIQQLNLSDATEPITAETDPYKIMQVHDYKSISFLRQPPSVKAASTEVIKQFALAYPELLKARTGHYSSPSMTSRPIWLKLTRDVPTGEVLCECPRNHGLDVCSYQGIHC